MGLFSFLKKAGAKIFDKAEKETYKPETGKVSTDALRHQKVILLKGVISSLGIEVKNLALDLQGERVVVSGEVDSQADKEKVILAIGNVEGIATVDDRMTVDKTEPEAVFYEVKKGDTLSKIAKAHYGDWKKYPAIFEANKPMLKHPDKIYPGQTLRIPKL